MADTRLPVFNNEAQTAYIDMRTESTNGQGRQVVVLGDPAVNDNVAAVATQDLGGTDQTTPGIVIRLAGSASVQMVNASISVHLQSTGGTVAVKLDPDFNITQKARSTSGTYGRTAINAGVRQIIAASATRKSVIFVHDSPNTIYIGLDNTVTSVVLGTGFPLVANQIFGFDDYTGAIFGTTESGEAIIKYIQI